MGKKIRTSPEYQKYFNNKIRIKNKTKKLEKLIERLEEFRKNEVINPNTKLSTKRRPIENIIKSCRIGRESEGFKKEDFKFKPIKRATQ